MTVANPRRTAAIEADRLELVALIRALSDDDDALVSSVRADEVMVDVDATGDRETVEGGARKSDKVDLAADRDLCMVLE